MIEYFIARINWLYKGIPGNAFQLRQLCLKAYAILLNQLFDCGLHMLGANSGEWR